MMVLDSLPACHYYATQAPDNRYNIAITYVLSHEGKLTNDKDDPGGITNYGISLRFLKEEELDIDRNGMINAEDIKGLSLEEAKKLYKEFFWDKYKYDNITYITLAKKIFDMAVNMGSSQAHKIVKRALNAEKNIRIVVDGNLSLDNINSINECDQKILLKYIRELERKFYIEIVNKNPKLNKFLNGWLKRAAE